MQAFGSSLTLCLSQMPFLLRSLQRTSLLSRCRPLPTPRAATITLALTPSPLCFPPPTHPHPPHPVCRSAPTPRATTSSGPRARSWGGASTWAAWPASGRVAASSAPASWTASRRPTRWGGDPGLVWGPIKDLCGGLIAAWGVGWHSQPWPHSVARCEGVAYWGMPAARPRPVPDSGTLLSAPPSPPARSATPTCPTC